MVRSYIFEFHYHTNLIDKTVIEASNLTEARWYAKVYKNTTIREKYKEMHQNKIKTNHYAG